MVNYDIFKKAKVKLAGVFDLGELYKFAHNWLEDEHKYDVVEKKYDEKTKAGGKSYTIEWDATRGIDQYSQFKLEIKWELTEVKDVSVEKGGEKIKMQQAKLTLQVSATLVTDYDEKWQEKPFFKFMQGFYEKYLYKSEIERLKTKMWEEGWDFFNEIKAFLHLYQYT